MDYAQLVDNMSEMGGVATMDEPKWDLFISHASEDKERFVEPLASRLSELAVRVWFDRFQLRPGMRLSEAIAEGLAKSRCGALVLSPSFIGKPWTSYEMSGLVNRFVEDGILLLPIWLGVSREEVKSLNPALADIFAINADENEIEKCALRILQIVRPQLYDNLSELHLLSSSSVKIKEEVVDIRTLKLGPIRHHDLPDSLLVRIRNIWLATRDYLAISLEETIENFQRDLEPHVEVEVWERVVSAFGNVCEKVPDTEDRRTALGTLLRLTSGGAEGVVSMVGAGLLDEELLEIVLEAAKESMPRVTISDVLDNGSQDKT